MDHEQQPERGEVYVTVAVGDRRASSGGRRRVAATIASLAAAAALSTVIFLMARSVSPGRRTPMGPPLPEPRALAGPPVLDADGDLDGSRRMLRLHFDPDDAGDLGAPAPGR